MSSQLDTEFQWLPGEDPIEEGGWPGLRIGLVEQIGDVIVERDVPVTMRDGITIYADVFRPAGLDNLPVLLTWSPYGKHAPKTFDLFPNSGVPEGSVSRQSVWEGPDPLHWCAQGYAVINGDSRGSWGSEGDLTIFGQQEAQDGHDVIEWAAALPWTNGRVGLAGVSYLCCVQYSIAATHPPHLYAINPWEGVSDFYREGSYHGGIPETHFLHFLQWSCRCSLGRVENIIANLRNHPLLDEYGANKICQDLSRIEVPAYVVADWGDQGLHTRGTIEAFRQMSSEHKFLEVHGRKKWQYYYQPSSLARQKAFYDRFLKGIENEVDEWPRVQIEIRERAEVGTWRVEREWPLARTEYRKLFLDPANGRLVGDALAEEGAVRYDAMVQDDRAEFTHVFEADTELTGYSKLRLWVEAEDGEDLDLFVALYKLDARGERVPLIAMAMRDDGPVALGWLRASHRELDEERSTDWQPWHRHQRLLALESDGPTPVDIEIWPASTLFRKGETLHLIVQGNDIYRYDLRQAQLHQDTVNTGTHIIHAGGRFDSHLLVPVIP
jgi:predicted acyl esterase